MKFKLLTLFVALFALSATVVAQDGGERDTLVMEFDFVPPNADSFNVGHDTVNVNIYAVNDVVLTGMSSAYKWNTPLMVLDECVITMDMLLGFSSQYVYYRNNVDSSNFYQKFQCTGIRISPGGLPADHPNRTLLATWKFHLTALPDSIWIDTTLETALSFVEAFSNEYQPYWYGALVQKYNGTSVNVRPGGLPATFALAQNYPNPFNPITKIQFDIPERTHVNLTVFNVLGQKVTTLVDEELAPQSYEAEWNGLSDGGNKVASGIYFYRLTAGDNVQTKKMMMLK